MITIIQKDADELLASGTIEQFTGGAGFYSNVFLVPIYVDGL